LRRRDAKDSQDLHEQSKPGGRLPKEFRFSTPEVYIRKQGDEIILFPRPTDWSEYIAAGTITSGPDDFMELIDDLPVQEREF